MPSEALQHLTVPPHPTSSLLPGLAAHSLCAEAHPYVPPDEVIAEQPTDHPSFGPPPKRVPSGDSPSTSSLPSGLAATSLCAEAHPYVPPDEVIAEQPTDHPSYGPLPPTTTQPKPPVVTPMSNDLGTVISHHTKLLRNLGWSKFVRTVRETSDLTTLENVNHPAKRLLKHYKHRGAPVKFSTEPWSKERVSQALARGAHKSCLAHTEFLQEEFGDMIAKSQWVILPASAVEDLPGLRISPPGVVPQRERRPRWICDYSFSGVNSETLPLAALDSMQFGHALDRILREILLADPAMGPVQMLKIDLSDGFYRLDLNVEDIPKLGVVFPTNEGEEPLVAFPLVLPMGWKNSPPVFSTATETIADLANQRLASAMEPRPHPLDEEAEKIVPESPLETSVSQRQSLPSILRRSSKHLRPGRPLRVRWDPTLPHSSPRHLPVPTLRDPSLPKQSRPLSYVDVFVDDFIGLAQQSGNSRRVRRILMHAIDDVFRPLEATDSIHRREPISLKKLRKGDCSWSTVKLVLGWIIDTANMTIHLPPHRVERLAEILASIPVTQRRCSVQKWYKVLGELRSMSLALPGSRNIFSHMQSALSLKTGNRVALDKGVHAALDDFRFILKDIANRPTRIAELVPLLASALGHHDASGTGAGGVWFPATHLSPRAGYSNKPVLWRLKWPKEIMEKLVTSTNRSGTISNSDLELAGALLHLEAICQSFDVRERTILSKTDNLNTLFWQRKGSTTSGKVPAHLLRLFGIHQRYHRYVPRFDYLSGPSNPVADALSRDFSMSWPQLTKSLAPHLPRKGKDGFQIWDPTPQVVTSVFSALHKKRSPPESLTVEPTAPTPPILIVNGIPTLNPSISWASNPLSKPSRTKYQPYKSMQNEFVLKDLQAAAIPSSLNRLKITYGELNRRSMTWGPRTHA